MNSGLARRVVASALCEAKGEQGLSRPIARVEEQQALSQTTRVIRGVMLNEHHI